jgi:hypothetical protein
MEKMEMPREFEAEGLCSLASKAKRCHRMELLKEAYARRGRLQCLPSDLIYCAICIFFFGALGAPQVAGQTHSGYAPGLITRKPNAEERTQGNKIQSKSVCLKRKGNWFEGRGYKFCVLPYPDAWKLCSSSKDCTGHCIVPPGGTNRDGQTLQPGTASARKMNHQMTAVDGISKTAKSKSSNVIS